MSHLLAINNFNKKTLIVNNIFILVLFESLGIILDEVIEWSEIEIFW